MKCIKCGKSAEVKVQNLNSCNSCFLKIIQKRVRKEIRLNELIKKNDRILVIDDGSAASVVSEYLLKQIIKDLPVEIKSKKMSYGLGDKVDGKYNKIIIPWSADKEDEYFLNCVFNNKKMKYLGHFILNKKKYVKLLLPVLDEEIELFAKIKKFKFKKIKKDSEISVMLDNLVKEYPEVKFSLLRSSGEINSFTINQ